MCEISQERRLWISSGASSFSLCCIVQYSIRVYLVVNHDGDESWHNLMVLGKPHRKNISVHLGIAQIAIGPPPRTQTGTLWHLFSGKIMQMPVCTKTFLLKIGATNHPGKGLDPPPKRAMPKWKDTKIKWGFPYSVASVALTSCLPTAGGWPRSAHNLSRHIA